MKKVGNQTIKFDNPPTILETASIVGPKKLKVHLQNALINVWMMNSGEKRLGKKQKVKL